MSKEKTATLMECKTKKMVEEIEVTSYKKAYDYFKKKHEGEFLLQYDWRCKVVKL